MKILKKVLTLIIVIALAASLTACCCIPFEQSPKIDGKWKGEIYGIDATFIFDEGDVEIILSAFGQTESSTSSYEFDGETLIIEDEKVPFEFKDKDTLILYIEDNEIELERQ